MEDGFLDLNQTLTDANEGPYNLLLVASGGGAPLHPPTPQRRHRAPVKAGQYHPNLKALYADYIELGMPMNRYAEDRLGVTRQTVASWFSGRKYPSAAKLELIRLRTGIVLKPQP